MDRRRHWALRLFCVLFTLSVSVAVLPCGIINVHGLFGEVNSSTIIEDNRQEICDLESKDHKKVQNEKGDTIVTLKVRMDN